MSYAFGGDAQAVAETIELCGNTCTFSGGAKFKAIPDEQNKRFRLSNATEGIDPDEANATIFLLPSEAFTAGLESQTFTCLGAAYKVRKVEPEGYGDTMYVTRLLCDRVS